MDKVLSYAKSPALWIGVVLGYLVVPKVRGLLPIGK